MDPKECTESKLRLSLIFAYSTRWDTFVRSLFLGVYSFVRQEKLFSLGNSHMHMSVPTLCCFIFVFSSFIYFYSRMLLWCFLIILSPIWSISHQYLLEKCKYHWEIYLGVDIIKLLWCFSWNPSIDAKVMPKCSQLMWHVIMCDMYIVSIRWCQAGLMACGASHLIQSQQSREGAMMITNVFPLRK